MDKFIKIYLLFLLPGFLSAQNQLINNGAVIKVQNGTDLRVGNSGILNKNAGTVDNNGNIYLDANYIQTTSALYNGGINSWLWFEGSVNQNITGDAALNIARLRVDNGNRLVLGNHVNVSNTVDIFNNKGDIELGNFNLVMAPVSTLTGYDANNYIITNGTGYLQREVGALAVDFPVGISNYNPATLTNSGTADNFRARLEDFVLGDYPLGNAETDDVVNRAWHITEEISGGSNVTMTLQWETSNELTGFDRTLSGISHWTGTAWDRSPTWANAATAGTGWSQTRTGITSFSPFAVEDNKMQLPIELLVFEAERINNVKVALNWTTASELNNKGFWIERMLENENEFEPVAWVDGFGNTNQNRNYFTEDDNSSTSISYYRLRQIDFDGTESFSEIRAVNGSEFNESSVVLFPNPAKDELYVRLNNLTLGTAAVEIRIIDKLGRILYSKALDHNSNSVIQINDISEWPAGFYNLNIRLNDGSMISKKFTKH